MYPSLLHGTECWYRGRTKPPRTLKPDRPLDVSAYIGWHIAAIDKTLAISLPLELRSLAVLVTPGRRKTPCAKERNQETQIAFEISYTRLPVRNVSDMTVLSRREDALVSLNFPQGMPDWARKRVCNLEVYRRPGTGQKPILHIAAIN